MAALAEPEAPHGLPCGEAKIAPASVPAHMDAQKASLGPGSSPPELVRSVSSPLASSVHSDKSAAGERVGATDVFEMTRRIRQRLHSIRSGVCASSSV